MSALSDWADIAYATFAALRAVALDAQQETLTNTNQALLATKLALIVATCDAATVPPAEVTPLFYPITAVDQTGGAGTNSFTVTDANGDLDDVTGTFEVIYNTGTDMNGTYTLVSAIWAEGETTLRTVEAIPDTEANGWAEFV